MRPSIFERGLWSAGSTPVASFLASNSQRNAIVAPGLAPLTRVITVGRATERISGAGLTGGLGKAFSFIVVHQDLDRSRYISDVTKGLVGDVSTEPGNPQNWTSRSTLEVFVNGLRNPHYVYEVTHAGAHAYAPHIGAYDAPAEEFSYTRFDCRLSRLD